MSNNFVLNIWIIALCLEKPELFQKQVILGTMQNTGCSIFMIIYVDCRSYRERERFMDFSFLR